MIQLDSYFPKGLVQPPTRKNTMFWTKKHVKSDDDRGDTLNFKLNSLEGVGHKKPVDLRNTWRRNMDRWFLSPNPLRFYCGSILDGWGLEWMELYANRSNMIIHDYVFGYIWLPASSEGCWLNLKGWCMGTPYHPFSNLRKMQVYI